MPTSEAGTGGVARRLKTEDWAHHPPSQLSVTYTEIGAAVKPGVLILESHAQPLFLDRVDVVYSVRLLTPSPVASKSISEVKTMRGIAFVMLLCVCTSLGNAQGYTPVGKKPDKAGGRFAFVLGTQGCKPSDIPTATTLRTKRFETRTTIKTGSELAKLNVTWFGGIGGA